MTLNLSEMSITPSRVSCLRQLCSSVCMCACVRVCARLCVRACMYACVWTTSDILPRHFPSFSFLSSLCAKVSHWDPEFATQARQDGQQALESSLLPHPPCSDYKCAPLVISLTWFLRIRLRSSSLQEAYQLSHLPTFSLLNLHVSQAILIHATS